MLMALSAPAVCGRTVGLTEARSIASQFFAESGMAGEPQAVSPQGPNSRSADSPAAYHVFNSTGKNGGFVIVSGDDRLGRVLGYSDRGEFSFEGAPDGLTALMKMYEAYASALEESETPGGRSTAKAVGNPVVAPLMADIHWGQDTYFNTLCPTYTASGTTTHYYVGCVATAATQIMRYHGYPERGTGSKTYTDRQGCGKTLSADFGNTVYDWANMPATPPENATQAQIDAYSTLCHHFGVAVEMQYVKDGSGAYDQMVAYALRNYFGYDKGTRGYLREYYSTTEWMKMIKDELDAGRPVFYGASSDNGSGGHAFVLDGYDDNDYVHVNWGWYGRSDGYFMINHLNPDELGAGGGYGGYNLNQDMVTGIRPPVAGSESRVAIYGATRLRANYYGSDFLMMAGIENIDVEAFKGTIAAVITDTDDKVVKELHTQALTLEGYSNGHSGADPVFTMRSVPANVDGLADGSYRLRFAYRAEGQDGWNIMRHPKGGCQYMDLTVRNGMITGASEHTPRPDVVLMSALDCYDEIFAGCKTQIGFDIDNRSTDYRIGKITVSLISTDDPAVKYEVSGTDMVYESSRKAFELAVELPAEMVPGEYELAAYDPAFPENMFDDSAVGATRVTVSAQPSTPVVRVRSAVVAATALQQGAVSALAVTMRNDGAEGTADLLMRLRNKADGKSSVFLQQSQSFRAGQTASVIFSRYVPQDAGTYEVEIYQLDADGNEVALKDFGGKATEVEIEPNPTAEAEVTAFDFPDRVTQGQRYSYAITFRGLKTGTTAVRPRIRRFTSRNGELVDMFSLQLTAGAETKREGTYRCGSSLEDGMYMVMLDNSSNIPYAGHAVYYKEVAVGNVTGVDDIMAREESVSVWVEGDVLVVATPFGKITDGIEIYAVSGAKVLAAEGAVPALSVALLPAGVYVARVSCTDGSVASVKFVK